MMQLKEGAPVRLKGISSLKERGYDIPDVPYTVTKSGRRGQPLEDNFFYTIDDGAGNTFEIFDHDIQLDESRVTGPEAVPQITPPEKA